jgi:hypothetical protein
MPKFGGVGKMKQCCLTKQCIAPILPSTASCQVCSKKKGSRKLSQLKPEEVLYECERCMEIHHLPCFHVCLFRVFNVLKTTVHFYSRALIRIRLQMKVYLAMIYLRHGYVQNVSRQIPLSHLCINYDPLYDVR